MRLTLHILTAISLSLLPTQALPIDKSNSELNVLALPVADSASGLWQPASIVKVGREIHNADFGNAGGPPQDGNSSSQAQFNGSGARPQHTSSASLPSNNTARSEMTKSNAKKSGFDRKKPHVPVLQNGEQLSNATQLADGHLVAKHAYSHNHQQATANNSSTVSSRKATHEDPTPDDDKKSTPPPPALSSNFRSLLGMETSPVSESDLNDKLLTRSTDNGNGKYRSRVFSFLGARRIRRSTSIPQPRENDDTGMDKRFTKHVTSSYNNTLSDGPRGPSPRQLSMLLDTRGC